MISKIFTSNQCLLSSAVRPIQKVCCVTFAFTGLGLAVSCLYYGGTKMHTYLKESKTSNKTSYSPNFKLCEPETFFATVFGLFSIVWTTALCAHTVTTIRQIRGTTECCNIMKYSLIYGIFAPVYTVAIMLCGYMINDCYKHASSTSCLRYFDQLQSIPNSNKD